MKRRITIGFVLLVHLMIAQKDARSQSASSIQICSGIGASPENINNILWNVKVLFALPILSNGSRLWLGFAPTMDPMATGDENAADGFFPLVLEYHYDLHGTAIVPFLFANTGAGPQFGDRSNHEVFQAAMFTLGAGLHTPSSAGFFGTIGLTYNTVLPRSNLYVLFDAGIAF